MGVKPDISRTRFEEVDAVSITSRVLVKIESE